MSNDNLANNPVYVLFTADYDVSLCRLMSQLADVNIQSTVGMFIFMSTYPLTANILYCTSACVVKTGYVQIQSIQSYCNNKNGEVFIACDSLKVDNLQ